MPKAAPSYVATEQSVATIQDVADHAGVSKATVSRFLNPGGRQLSAELQARVSEAVRVLGYSPSPMAQALKRGRSRLIGLVVADVTNPFSVAVLRGAEKACREAGYLVMLFNLGNDHVLEREAVRALSSYQVEGFILHTLGDDSAPLADAVRMQKPVVLIDRRAGDVQLDLVSLDNPSAVRLAVDHLVQAGYSRLLFVTEPFKGVSSREDRERAFHRCLAQYSGGVEGRSFEVVPGKEGALDDALRGLKRGAGRRPIGVLAANSVTALAAALSARRLGWQLGSDLGLLGFDDPDWAPLIGPGLSTISQPTDEIGRVAAACLIERLKGLELSPRQVLLPGTLHARGSTQRD